LPLFGRFNPNPKFRSEELNGYEAGYRLLLRKSLYLDIAAFYNHYGDLLSEDITGPPSVETNPGPPHILIPAELANGLVGTTKGVEFAPEWRPLPFWRLRASYSYLQMDITKPANSQDAETPSTIVGSSPKHQIALQSGLDFAKAFSFDLTYRYVDALPALAIPSYSTADTRFDWRVLRQYKLSVVGRNLFQPHHFEYGGVDPGPDIGIKRSVYGQITWQR
jgi:iron complex outermembrane receptor protein